MATEPVRAEPLDISRQKTREDVCADWIVQLTPELRRHLRRSYAYVNQADQEDLIQDAFITFVGSPDVTGSGYRGDLSSRHGVLCFLRKVLAFKAMEYLQRETGTKDPDKAVQVLSLDSPEVVAELEGKGIDPDAEDTIQEAQIYAFILEPLPPTLRILVDRYYIKGESIEDIAKDFGFTNRMTLFRRLMKARVLLKPRLLELRRMRKEGRL